MQFLLTSLQSFVINSPFTPASDLIAERVVGTLAHPALEVLADRYRRLSV